jgi:hypothetical protein
MSSPSVCVNVASANCPNPEERRGRGTRNRDQKHVRGKNYCPRSILIINSIWNEEELTDQWKESVIVPIHKTGDKTAIIIVG